MTSKPKSSWRDVLPVHPAAEMFPLLKDTDPDALRALGEDIKQNGMVSPVTFWVPGKEGKPLLLDGRNRLDALEAGGVFLKWGPDGVEPVYAPNGKSLIDVYVCCERHPCGRPWIDPYAYVISANIRRRHLNVEDRQNILIELIARSPQKSNRQIAEDTGVDHKTVGRARAKGEQLGRIAQLTKTVGKDGKARRPPSKAPAPEVVASSSDDGKDTCPGLRNLDEEVRQRVLAETKDYLAMLKAREEEADKTIATYKEFTNNHKPLFAVDQFKIILMCLHPDGQRSADKLAEAFRLFNGKKFQLTGVRE
ncbi:helix-turn-helix domain-containing protein [Bradyrhizobium sp. UFLA05-153]